MVQGLMQDVPLTIDLILRRATQVGRDVPVVSIEPAGERRSTWGEVAHRALAPRASDAARGARSRTARCV